MTRDSYNSKHMQYLCSMYPNAPYIAYGSAAKVLAGYVGADIYWIRLATTSLILGVHWGWYV